MTTDRSSDTAPVDVRGVALRVGEGESTQADGGGVASGGARVARSTDAAPVASADLWPGWAVPQLDEAVQVVAAARAVRDVRGTAVALYRDWFAPTIDAPATVAAPLAGVYRRAHAGSSRRIAGEDITTVARQDVVGRDGWWRTWGPAWRPLRSRAETTRVLLSPTLNDLAELVRVLTASLIDADFPWLLACPIDAGRLRRAGGVVLHVPDVALVAPLLAQVSPLLHGARPPLCLPVAPGVAVAADPSNGMTFGEHRCHLVALGLGLPRAAGDPQAAIADVFVAHGVDPGAPWR